MDLCEAMRLTNYIVACPDSEIVLGTGPWTFTEDDLTRTDWVPRHRPKSVYVAFHEYHLLQDRGYLSVLGSRKELEPKDEVLVEIIRDTCKQRIPLRAFVSRIDCSSGMQLTELESVKTDMPDED